MNTTSSLLTIAATVLVLGSMSHAATSGPDHDWATQPLSAADQAAADRRQGAQARQVELYSTFNTDPNHLYDFNLGGAISGPDTGVKIAWGASFTPVRAGFAKTVTLALTHVSGTNEVRVSLHEDASGMPGTLIRKGTARNLPSFRDNCCPTVSVSLQDKDNAPPYLTGSTTYWLLVEPTKNGTDTDAVWHRNNLGVNSRVYRQYGAMKDAFVYTTFAFKVTGR